MITINQTSGDHNSLHVLASFAFDPIPRSPDFRRESAVGSWSDGSFHIRGFFSKSGPAVLNEGIANFTIRATWTDGWNGLLFSEGYFVWGTSNPISAEICEPNRTNKGLSYIFEASYHGTLTTQSNFSGSGIINFDLCRRH